MKFTRTALLLALAALLPAATPERELRFCLRADPKTFDPLLSTEEASETIRYLTNGVLIRFNRSTQQLQPELAESWKVRDGGSRIDFKLRRGVRFSDGSEFDAQDVIATIGRLRDPALRSPVADTFRRGSGQVSAVADGSHSVSIRLSAPIAGLEQLFDGLAILSSGGGEPQRAVLGPFVVQEHRSGQYVLLRRNPHYWKKDRDGRRLPYLDAIRLDIQANRESELLRFRRGELHLIEKLEPEAFDRLRRETPDAAVDAGPSLSSEFLWFNQNPAAPVPAHKQQWFRSRLFRRAISLAVNREDMIRLVYRGRAGAAVGPVSPSNRAWFNEKLRAPKHDPAEALRLLAQDGFRLDGQTLRDRAGNPVEFSLVTNAGSRPRTQLGTLVQQDLRKIGIRLNFTPLEFQSLIDRITRTQDYEACLLGFNNIEPDPNAQMNVWLSSSTHHAWYPGQKTPATEWEAEIDRLMRAQAAAPRHADRRKAFDRVQEIACEQAPIVYLVHPGTLLAVSPSVRNAAPTVLPPFTYWNAEYLALGR